MTSDEARAEAEWRMQEQRESVGLMVIEQTRFIEGFEQGADWQAERDAERIAELEAEVERLRVPGRTAEAVAKVTPCSCSAQRARAEAAEEECERLRQATDIVCAAEATSRVTGETVQATAEALVQFAALHSIARAEAAEAKLAAVREYIVAVQNTPGLSDTGHHARWLREALAVLDGESASDSTRNRAPGHETPGQASASDEGNET